MDALGFEPCLVGEAAQDEEDTGPGERPATRVQEQFLPVAAVAGQALGNAIVGAVAFQIVELLPGAMERRRAMRGRLRR